MPPALMPIDPHTLWRPQLDFRGDLALPYAVLGLPRAKTPDSDPYQTHLSDAQRDKEGLLYALEQIFEGTDYPTELARKEVHWRRDALGKPFIAWEGGVLDWAEAHELDSQHLHLSNSHDGEAHLLFVTYNPRLIGVGIDVVLLSRFQNKTRADLHRFARKIMSETEFLGIESYLREESEAELRNRIVAHFSLMEAASKACGTGLKLGLGMGRPTSLPVRSLGVRRVFPTVELLFEEPALQRIADLGVTRDTGYLCCEEAYLTSVALLWR